MAARKHPFDDEELIKILDFLLDKENTNRNELKKKIGHEKANTIISLLCNKKILGLIVGSPKKSFKIYHEMLYEFRNVLSNRILQTKQTKIQRYMFIVTVILVGGTLYFYFVQTNILNKQVNISEIQNKILENSTPPYDPKLRIWINKNPVNLILQNLLNEINQTEHIEICIKNMGQTSTGHIYAEWSNNWSHPSSLNINDLESGEAKCDDLYLVAKGCMGTDRNCNKEIVPIGNTTINLKVNCQFCPPEPKERIIPFDAKIWDFG